MKCTVLGCYGPYPVAGGATSGYLVSHQGQYVLMDCGSGILGRLLERMDPALLSGILMSHLHWDHASDLFVLGYYLQQRGARLPLFVPPEVEAQALSMLPGNVYDIRPYPEKMELANLTVTTCPMRHPVPCRAIRLEGDNRSFVFTGDTNTCDALISFARNADVLLCDAAFLDSEWKEHLPHLSAKKAAEAALQADVKQLYLTHLPPAHDPITLEKEARQVFNACCTVKPGMDISV